MKKMRLLLMVSFCFMGALTISSCSDISEDTTPMELPDEASDSTDGGGEGGQIPPPPPPPGV